MIHLNIVKAVVSEGYNHASTKQSTVNDRGMSSMTALHTIELVTAILLIVKQRHNSRRYLGI